MLLGSDGLGLIDVRRLRAGAHDRDRRARADPVRGRPGRGLAARSARCSAPAVSLAIVGTLVTALIAGLVAALAVRPLAARGPAARRDPLLDRRRGDLRDPARVDAAPAPGAHARGRVGLQRPGRGPARPRVHRVDPAARLRPRRHGRCCSCSELGIGLVVGVAVGWLAVQAFRRARLATGGLYPVALAGDRRPRVRAGRHRSHGSGFLAVYLAGLALGGATIPAKRTVIAFHEGLGWVAQLDDVPHARPARVPVASSTTSRLEGTVLALVVVVVARPLAAVRRDARRSRFTLARAARARLGGPARRGAGRARDVPGDRGRRGQPRVLQHRLLRRAPLDAAAGHDVRGRSRGGSG